MNKIKKNWLTIILVLALLVAGYKIYQDKEEISSLEHENYYLRSDKSTLEVRVIELEEELDDCNFSKNNQRVNVVPTTPSTQLEYIEEDYYNSNRSTELEND